MKRRWKILIVAGVLLGMGMLLAVVRHYQLRWATEAYITQLKAQGEPMDLAQVLPPPVPPEENGADTLRRATAVTESDEGWWAINYVNGMIGIAAGKAMVCWQQPEIRNDFRTDSWQEVETAITKDKPALAQLRQIVPKPNFDFQLNYEAGVANLNYTNLNVAEAKRASERLSAEAIDDLHNGNIATAVEDLRAMLAIAQALRDERLAISELVRMAIAQIALSANWELLQSSNVSDQQLASLQNDWTNFDFIVTGEDALAMERVIGRISTARWRGSDSELEREIVFAPQMRETLGLPPEPIWRKIIIKPELFIWRYWWSYEDELRSLKGYEVLMDTMRLTQTNGYFRDALQNQNDELYKLGIFKLDNEVFFSSDTDLHSMISESVLTLSAFVNRAMRAQVAKQMIVTAIALKRYQLKHGNYPPDLNSLVPEFVPAVPLDPVDGQPLRYRLKTDGTFLLYSVGPNGKDDGGNPSLEKFVESSSYYWLNPHALDWVWPQPATPEEIKNFYAHSPGKN
jgi:hypothetical protein